MISGRLCAVALSIVGLIDAFAASADPEEQFLKSSPPYIRERGIFYSSDKLLRLDLDLNNDGAKEILLSINRDRDGKQGNIWKVYRGFGSGFVEAGTMTFPPNRFYLGSLESGQYGLATFGPAGAGEGIVWGYVFDGTMLHQIKLGEVVLNRDSMKLEGAEILDQYLGANATNGDDLVATTAINELAGRYGLTVDSKSYEQAVEDGLTARTPSVTPTTASSPTGKIAEASQTPIEAQRTEAPSTSTATAEQTKTISAFWRWAFGGFLLVAFALVATLIWRRQG